MIKSFFQEIWPRFFNRFRGQPWIVIRNARQVLIEEIQPFVNINQGLVISIQLLKHQSKSQMHSRKPDLLVNHDYLFQLRVSCDDVSVVIGLVARPCKHVFDDNNLIGFIHVLSFELEVTDKENKDGWLSILISGVIAYP